MTVNDDDDDDVNRLMQAMKYREEQICNAIGFDIRQDRAALVLRFIQAFSDTGHEDHDHPVLGPILKQTKDRYDAVRRHGISLAYRVAVTEGIRTIMALPIV